jgi:phosphoglycolate phosphatase-like HAD superfamily hydrolase
VSAVRVTVVLFDIDGTLLRAGGAGRRAVEIAVADVVGRPGQVSLESMEFAGRTDPWIIREALSIVGVAASDALVLEVLERYIAVLPGELERSDAFEVLPGVSPLLADLTPRDDVVMGLGTGNAERAAYAKLSRGGLDSYFSFGGFGSDHIDRSELLRIGLERGRRLAGRNDVRPVVIGDTPRDVAAAKAIGADCVAVATGGYEEDVLRAAGATTVVPDLLAAEVVDVLSAA